MEDAQESINKTALWFAIAVPIVMIGVIAAMVYIPRLAPKETPIYDFVYQVGQSGYYAQVYRINNGSIEVIEKKDIEDPYYREEINVGDVQLYLHDIETNSSSPLTYEDAKQFTYSSSPVAPDGFELRSGGGASFLFFDVRNQYTRYLVKDSSYYELDLALGEQNYWTFSHVGWVVDKKDTGDQIDPVIPEQP